MIDSLVEIEATFFDKNDEETYDYIRNMLWEKDLDNTTECLLMDEETKLGIMEPPDVTFIENNVGLNFKCIGESNDGGVSSGVESLLDQDTYDTIFEGFESELFKMAYEERQKRIDNVTVNLHKDLLYEGDTKFKCIRFITAWEYNAYQSNHPMDPVEWDYDIELLGIVRLSDIANLLTKSNQRKEIQNKLMSMGREEFYEMIKKENTDLYNIFKN